MTAQNLALGSGSIEHAMMTIVATVMIPPTPPRIIAAMDTQQRSMRDSEVSTEWIDGIGEFTNPCVVD